MAKAGIDENAYDGFIFGLNGVGGSAWNTERYSYFADHKLTSEDLAHEFGHMLGPWHANSWTCLNNELVGPSVENVLAGGCTVPTYGDLLSVLGTGNFRHPHVLHKYNVGWLAPSQVQIVSQAGIYEISAREAPNTAPVMIQIRLSGVSEKIFYFLEYVKPIGYDSELVDPVTAIKMNVPDLANQTLEGILVHLRYDNVAGGHPPTGGTGETAIIKTVIRDGQDFEDEPRGLTIKLVAFKPGNTAEIEIIGNF